MSNTSGTWPVIYRGDENRFNCHENKHNIRDTDGGDSVLTTNHGIFDFVGKVIFRSPQTPEIAADKAA